jgi:O-antigen/teichoic acid export membrane protein
MTRSQPNRKQAALLLMTGRVVGSMLTIVTAGVLARCWSEQEYGGYRAVMLAFQAMSSFATLGIPTGLTFFLSQASRGRQKATVAQAGLLLAGCGGLVSAVTIGWNLAWPAPDAGSGLSAAVAFALYPVFALPLLVADTWLLTIQRSRTAAWFIIQTSILQSAAAILPALAGFGVPAVLGCLTFATFVRFVIAFRIYRSEYHGDRPDLDPAFPLRLLRHSVPLGLAGLVGSINLMLDKLFISCWATPAEFAVYCNGATELPVIGIISGSVAAVLAPEFVRLFQAGRLQEMLALWRSSLRITATVVLPLTAGMLLFAADAVTLLYSEKYLESVPIFRIYLLVLPLRITVHGSLLVAAGRSQTVFSAAVIGVVLAAGLLCALVPVFGMPGAAAAMVLSVYGVAGVLLFRTARLVGTSLRETVPWWDLSLTLAASAAGAALAALVTRQLDPGWVRLVVGLGITGFVCCLIHAAAGGSRSQLLAMITAVTGRRPVQRGTP